MAFENIHITDLEAVYETVSDLDNPDNAIYKDALLLLTIRPFVTMVLGVNPKGGQVFKLVPNASGLAVIEEYNRRTVTI